MWKWQYSMISHFLKLGPKIWKRTQKSSWGQMKRWKVCERAYFISQHSSLNRSPPKYRLSGRNIYIWKSVFSNKIRALLRTSTVTNLLIARFLRSESAVDRLEKKIEVWEIVQPVCPPRSHIIKPGNGHYCLKSQSNKAVKQVFLSGTLRCSLVWGIGGGGEKKKRKARFVEKLSQRIRRKLFYLLQL